MLGAECVGGGPGAGPELAAGIPEILRGKGPATMTFLSSGKIISRCGAQGGVREEPGQVLGTLDRESETSGGVAAQGAQLLLSSGARTDSSEVLSRFPPTR